MTDNRQVLIDSLSDDPVASDARMPNTVHEIPLGLHLQQVLQWADLL